MGDGNSRRGLSCSLGLMARVKEEEYSTLLEFPDEVSSIYITPTLTPIHGQTERQTGGLSPFGMGHVAAEICQILLKSSIF